MEILYELINQLSWLIAGKLCKARTITLELSQKVVVQNVIFSGNQAIHNTCNCILIGRQKVYVMLLIWLYICVHVFLFWQLVSEWQDSRVMVLAVIIGRIWGDMAWWYQWLWFPLNCCELFANCLQLISDSSPIEKRILSCSI